MSEPARALLANAPVERDGKSEWLRAIARDAEITLYLTRHLLGAEVEFVGLPFPCVLHGDGCLARLTTGRNGEIVYQDGVLAGTPREFQTIPELAVALLTRVPKRLSAIQHALWRLRLLHQAGLVRLPIVPVPPLADDSSAHVHRAREGFELLVRFRWFLDPNEPVAYTRAFVEIWCDIEPQRSREAIYELIRQGVITKVGETASGRTRPTHLYLPGSGRPITGERGVA